MYKCVQASYNTKDDCSNDLPETLVCIKKGGGYSISNAE